MKKRIRAWDAIALFVLVAVSCASEEERYAIAVGDAEFTVEIANTPEERQRGLMHRNTLAPNEGMLFVFPDDAPRAFWMKDTPLPLSIAYIDRRGTILEIYDMEPFSLETVRSRFAVRYALEVRQGRFTELGIVPGDRVEIPPVEAE
jgi:hypothetical protein